MPIQAKIFMSSEFETVFLYLCMLEVCLMRKQTILPPLSNSPLPI